MATWHDSVVHLIPLCSLTRHSLGNPELRTLRMLAAMKGKIA